VIDPDVLIQTSRGCYYPLFFDLVDEVTRLPVSLVGYNLVATYRERGKTALLATTPTGPKLAITDAVNGKFSLVIDGADTRVLPSRDITYCGCYDDLPYTCFCQVEGQIGGNKYDLITIAIDNISSTAEGET
jgi:hypothetical protein